MWSLFGPCIKLNDLLTLHCRPTYTPKLLYITITDKPGDEHGDWMLWYNPRAYSPSPQIRALSLTLIVLFCLLIVICCWVLVMFLVSHLARSVSVDCQWLGHVPFDIVFDTVQRLHSSSLLKHLEIVYYRFIQFHSCSKAIKIFQ